MAIGNVLPALVLLYSTIDCMVWITRPATTDEPQNEDVTRTDFKHWCSDYMNPDATLGCSAVDLYAARCSVLHTQISQSRLSREAGARELCYQQVPGEVLLSVGLNAPLEPIIINVLTLFDSFRAGVARFLADCNSLKLQPLVSVCRAMFFVRACIDSVPHKPIKFRGMAVFGGSRNRMLIEANSLHPCGHSTAI